MHRIFYAEAEFNNKNNFKGFLMSACAPQRMLKVTKIKGLKISSPYMSIIYNKLGGNIFLILKIPSLDKDREQPELSCIAGGNVH